MNTNIRPEIVKSWQSYGFRQFLSLLGTRGAEVPNVKTILNPIGQEGTSCTDGKNIYLTCWEDLFYANKGALKFAATAWVGHEAEHIRSSNFDDIKDCAKLVGFYYKQKYGFEEELGQRLGATLYNIIEDGRIERIYTARFPGSCKNFQFINGMIYKKNSEMNNSKYSDFIANILCLSKCGVNSPIWIKYPDGTEENDLMLEIADDIFKAINSNFTEDVKGAVLIINNKISDFIKEGLEKDDEFMKQLKKMAEANYNAKNSKEKQTEQADANGSGSGSGSGGSGAHIGSPSSSSGSGSISDDLDKSNANKTQISSEEIEKKIQENEETANADDSMDKILNDDKTKEQQEKRENSDGGISKEDLKKIENDTNIDVSGTKISDFQNGISNLSQTYELPPELKEQGLYIYNSLKILFKRKVNKYNRNLDNGLINTKKLARYSAMKNSGMPERNIFEKKNKDINPSVAALCVADISGSTHGKLFNQIISTLSILEDGFGQLIPLKLMTYEGGGPTNINVLKDFNNKIKRLNYSYNFMRTHCSGGGTPTAEAMAIGGYELEKRTEKKKILFVITDGEPNDSKIVKEITKKLRLKGIKVVAILINNNEQTKQRFEDMYSNKDIIAVDESIFGKVLINTLAGFIKS